MKLGLVLNRHNELALRKAASVAREMKTRTELLEEQNALHLFAL